MARYLDRLTLLALVCAGVTSSAVTGLSAALPFLRQELELSYTQSGMHSSAYALGVILAGLWGDRWIARSGAMASLRLSAAGLALGMLAFGLAGHPYVTLSSSLVMGAMAAVMTTVALSAFSQRPA
ncbi:MAG: hypothetical protein AB1758_37520, partial [Candidatus Eremiobacterota bacterium]